MRQYGFSNMVECRPFSLKDIEALVLEIQQMDAMVVSPYPGLPLPLEALVRGR